MQKLKLTKKYQKYPEYKDSGVEWIGKIPKEWSILKGKFVFRNKKEINVGMKNDNVLSLTMNGVINRDSSSNEGLLPSDYQTFQIFEKDDLVFKLIDLENYKTSRVGIVHEKGIMSPVYIRLESIKGQIPKYFYYLYYAFYIEGIYNFLGSGVRSALGPKDLLEMNVSIPDLKIQNDITKYLDTKIADINLIIEKKQKMIELFKEKRTAVINHAVTSVTGTTEKLKYIAPERKIKLDIIPLNMKYIGLENIESLTGKIIESAEKVEPESSVNAFYENDVLFGKLRPYLAKVLAVDFDGVCSGEFLTLIPNEKKIISRFLSYKLISKDFIKLVNDSTYGTKMPRANWQFIGNQIITYPSLDVQKEIVGTLDSKIQTFEKIIMSVSRSIEILQEFKSSLISNVVTGKIKI
jgi:type I restriction enzyme S subunit